MPSHQLHSSVHPSILRRLLLKEIFDHLVSLLFRTNVIVIRRMHRISSQCTFHPDDDLMAVAGLSSFDARQSADKLKRPAASSAGRSVGRSVGRPADCVIRGDLKYSNRNHSCKKNQFRFHPQLTLGRIKKRRHSICTHEIRKGDR